MKKGQASKINLKDFLQAETVLENAFLDDPIFVRGLFWGVPRYGHPEGEVYKHIAEVLANIDRLDISTADRNILRTVTFVHDTFKCVEDKTRPRNWKKHHATLARNYLEKYTDDITALTITEWHDEAYYVWRDIFLHKDVKKGNQRLESLLKRLSNFRQLYYLFVKCDTQTGDKNQAPLNWIEANFPGIKIG